MKIEFFPYDFEYKVMNGKTYVYLYAKEVGGRKMCVVQPYQPYFYASVDGIDLPALEKRLAGICIKSHNPKNDPARVVSWEAVTKELLGKEKKLYKIYTNYPKAVPLVAKELESWDMECFERDILFIHRYLRDNNITPMMLTAAEGEFVTESNDNNKVEKDDEKDNIKNAEKYNSLRVPLFKAIKINPARPETPHQWKICAVDIETYAQKKEIDPDKNPILMIAFAGNDYGKENDKKNNKEFAKVITWKKMPQQAASVEVVNDEAALLARFKDIITEFQPDILTGYFSDGFDLPYIKMRADKHKIHLDLGLDYSPLIINSNSGFRDSVGKIAGILHLDILKFIKNIFGKNLKTDSFSLNAVAGELLGDRKHEVNLDELSIVWDNHPERLLEFCNYNLQDARLTLQLCQHLLYDIIEFTKVIGLPTFDVIRMTSSRLVENYIITRAVPRNVLAPNRPGNYELEQRRRESVQGGFVYEPTPGLYKDIIVFDFLSLYPTIITSHNIGPESFQCACCQEKAAVPSLKNHWFCRREKKFLPSLLEELIHLRAGIKKEIKEAKSHKKDTQMLQSRLYAFKILANSFYGYLGFFGARWYSLPSAAATTAYARDYIKKTIAIAHKKKLEVIYADTDSCFIVLGEKKKEDALAFMDSINKNLPGTMELEFEGHFQRGIFVSVKGSTRGAKKKYALLAADGTLKITGFETVRRNWSLLAKEVQKTVLQLVLTDKKEEALSYLRTIVKYLRAGTMPLDKLILKTQITKDLSSYTSIGPHVKVAQEMAKQGEKITPGMVVSYIVVKGTGLVRDRAHIPAQVQTGEYDAEYYLRHQIVTAVSSIFAILGCSEEELTGDSSQTGLGKFF